MPSLPLGHALLSYLHGGELQTLSHFLSLSRKVCSSGMSTDDLSLVLQHPKSMLAAALQIPAFPGLCCATSTICPIATHGGISPV